ncbi:prosaposin-like [Telopea speciosissima]|uniref:prosaposin-like n=1 Tax=Telopea speciosissima TaxID=54955 RepID=UPI001CC49105|nr:prosaposin-like [Telopea speciosissima]
MNTRTVPLFFAFLVSLVYVDARHIFSDSGKLADTGVTSVQIQPVFRSSEGLSPELICLSCLEVSRKTVKAISDPLLPEKVSAFVNDACQILPSDMRVKCVEMLEMNINQAIVFLKDYFSEEKLCNSTGLCPTNANTFSLLIFGKDLRLSLDRDLLSKPAMNTRLLPKEQIASSMLQKFTNKISENKSCAACHAAIEDIRNDLEDPKMKIKVIRILLKACENVENNIKECKRMVLKYGPLILANLEKYLSNNDLCSMAHICKPMTGNTFKAMESFRPLIELPTSSKTDAISK